MGSMTTGGRVPLIAGNWKMNLDHLQSIAFVQKLAWSLKDARHDFAQVEVAVFPLHACLGVWMVENGAWVPGN